MIEIIAVLVRQGKIALVPKLTSLERAPRAADNKKARENPGFKMTTNIAWITPD
jgi:hypothetical protein